MIFKPKDKVKYVTMDGTVGIGSIVWVNAEKNTICVQGLSGGDIYEVSAEDAILAYDAMKDEYAKLGQEDNVNHPKHYCNKPDGIETIAIVDHMVMGLKPRAAVRVGNATKYIDRHQNKNGIEDIKKAIWYLQDYVDHYYEFNEV